MFYSALFLDGGGIMLNNNYVVLYLQAWATGTQMFPSQGVL